MYFLSVPKDNDIKKDSANTRVHIDSEIERMIDLYGNDVLRTSYMYLKDFQKAEDAFQEVFCKVYKKYGSFRGDSSERTWIIRITINVCKDLLRSFWLKRVLLTDKIGPDNQESDVESKIIKKDENRRLFEEVTSLPPKYKEVIILYYYHNFDTAELSKVLNIAEGTVRSRLHRGREMLKTRMGGGVKKSGQVKKL